MFFQHHSQKATFGATWSSTANLREVKSKSGLSTKGMIDASHVFSALWLMKSQLWSQPNHAHQLWEGNKNNIKDFAFS